MTDDIFDQLAKGFEEAREALPEIKGLLLFDVEGVSVLADLESSEDELTLAYAASELLENINFFLDAAESTEWKSIIFENDAFYFTIAQVSDAYFLLSKADSSVELQVWVDKVRELAEQVAEFL